jgi:protein-S-isoprenylcysteine O-methyltransferase Ste14
VKLSDRRVRLGVAWLLVLPFLWYARPTPLSLVAGGVLALAGGAIRAWAAGHIRKDATLTVTGPYAHVRNPLYVGSFLVGLGVTVAGAQPVFVVLFLSFYLLVYSRTALDEARWLEEKFGDAYQLYASQVPLFVPRPIPWRPEGATGDTFSSRRYRMNKEWEAGLGILAGMLLLAVKMLLAG